MVNVLLGTESVQPAASCCWLVTSCSWLCKCEVKNYCMVPFRASKKNMAVGYWEAMLSTVPLAPCWAMWRLCCAYSSVLGHLDVFGAMLDHVQAMVGFWDPSEGLTWTGLYHLGYMSCWAFLLRLLISCWAFVAPVYLRRLVGLTDVVTVSDTLVAVTLLCRPWRPCWPTKRVVPLLWLQWHPASSIGHWIQNPSKEVLKKPNNFPFRHHLRMITIAKIIYIFQWRLTNFEKVLLSLERIKGNV